MLRINDLFDVVDAHVVDKEVRQRMHQVTRWILAVRAALGIENRLAHLLELQSRLLSAALEATCSAIAPEELTDYLSRVEEIVFTGYQAEGDSTTTTSLVTSSSDGCTTKRSQSASCEVDSNFSTSTAGSTADLFTYFHDDMGRLWDGMRRASLKSNVALFLALLALGASASAALKVFAETPERYARVDIGNI